MKTSLLEGNLERIEIDKEIATGIAETDTLETDIYSDSKNNVIWNIYIMILKKVAAPRISDQRCQ